MRVNAAVYPFYFYSILLCLEIHSCSLVSYQILRNELVEECLVWWKYLLGPNGFTNSTLNVDRNPEEVRMCQLRGTGHHGWLLGYLQARHWLSVDRHHRPEARWLYLPGKGVALQVSAQQIECSCCWRDLQLAKSHIRTNVFAFHVSVLVCWVYFASYLLEDIKPSDGPFSCRTKIELVAAKNLRQKLCCTVNLQSPPCPQ